MSKPAQEQAPSGSLPPPSAPVRPLTAAAVVAALGVVFGDIGTSPLYAFRECLNYG
ncbi:MAG: potassium transporter, partial [Verrucomicrobiota bacterium]